MNSFWGAVELAGAPLEPLPPALPEESTWNGPGLRLGQTAGSPFSPDGQVWIIADARIDDRKRLLEEFAGRDCQTEPAVPDAELILRAFQIWGERCLEHLLGDFAFAIWDSRDRHLFCAVDHLGVRPLYYAQTGNRLSFANSLARLRRDPGIPDRLCDRAVGDFLLFGQYQSNEFTIYRDIRRLPAGFSLSATAGVVKLSRYWQASVGPEAHFRDSAECVDGFRAVFSQAVADRLRGRPAGVLLSGGIDSALVALTARELPGAGDRLQTHTIGYESFFPDEEPACARISAEALRLPWQLCEPETSAEAAATPVPPEPAELPMWNWHLRFLQRVYQRTPLVLTGYDGDALLLASLPWHWRTLLFKGRFGRLARDLTWYLRDQRGLPPVGMRTAWANFRSRFSRQMLPDWLNHDFVARAHLKSRLNEVSKPFRYDSTRSPAAQILNSPCAAIFDDFDPSWTGLPLEALHPFFDLRVIRFLLSLPPIPWCIDKTILRSCLMQDLPEKIWRRPKCPLRGEPILAALAKGLWRYSGMTRTAPELSCFVELQAVPLLQKNTSWGVVQMVLRLHSLNLWLLNRPHCDCQETTP